MTYEFTPTVDPAAEFLEISNDFTDPKEIIRESISNAFDAKATQIWINILVDKSTGIDELIIEIKDNGEGMDEDAVKKFFGLGHSTRRLADSLGYKVQGPIGEKGHGTKIYFNSAQIEVVTVRNGSEITATMKEPKICLRKGDLPKVTCDIRTTDREPGTTVRVRGYNDNNQAGFGHETIRDYIYWFTKFGSFEMELDNSSNKTVVLHLRGLGRNKTTPEPLQFGHPFPAENTNIVALKKTDKVAPLDFYVARWAFVGEPVLGLPNANLDLIFYIEGDRAKRIYNKKIHERNTLWREGQYSVEQRYGLWVAKDYIPITRRNEWVALKSEWTKYHAFVNCQEFNLTANRASVENTPPQILEAIERTVRAIFEERIKPTVLFQKYLQELEKEQQYRDATAEEKDFERRKKAALNQKVCMYDGKLMIEPRQEGGVFSLVMQLLTFNPDVFGFTVIDYDTAFGYDLLVTKDTALDLNKAALRFVEMKYELHREFNHSFARLAAVICWDTRLANEDIVIDMCGERRTMRITPLHTDDETPYTKHMLVSDTSPHNIEVFVLKDFLKERMNIEFRPRTKE
jgi:hypothetical protein